MRGENEIDEEAVTGRRGPTTKPRQPAYLAAVVGVAAVYFGAVRLGLRFGIVEQVTPIWPPTGIALAAVVLYGYRIWPGVALGAFLANLLAHEPLVTAVGVAVGNTLEAVVGAWLLQRVVGFRAALTRLKDVLGLLFLAAALSTLISATVGLTSLCLGGVHPWSVYGSLWWTWWLGDALGDLIMAPLLLTWAVKPRARLRLPSTAECGALLAAVVAMSLTVFAGGLGPAFSQYPLEYTVFPFVIWAAIRFGPHVTTLVTFLISVIGIWGTAHGFGPFAVRALGEGLIQLQLFTGVIAWTGLVLAGVMAEYYTATRHRAAAYAATQILARSAPLAETISGVLAAIGQGFGWDLGSFWEVEPHGNALVGVWRDASMPPADAAHVGVGLPGRVWNGISPHWVVDAPEESGWLAAAGHRLRTAFVVPIVLEGKLLGIIEFFSRARRELDPDLLELTTALGGQVGLFLERRRAEELLRQSHDLLKAVTEGTTDAIFVKDLLGRYVMINSAGARLVGKTVDEVLGRDDAAFFSADTAHKNREVDLHIHATGETLTFENTVELAEGPRTSLITKGPYRDRTGQVAGVIGITHDITERKQAEQALQESHNLLSAVIEGIPDAIFLKDLQGRYLLANSVATGFVGKPPSELLGHDDTAWFEPETARRVMEADRRVLQSGATVTYEDVGTVAGVSRTYLTTKAPFRSPRGEIVGVLGIARDITERKRAVVELKREKEVLQTIFDHIPVMIAFIDPAGRIRLVNRHWEEVLGWSWEEARNLDIFAECYPDPQYRQQVLESIGSASGGWFDFKTRVRGGRTIDTSWTNVLLSDGMNLGIGQDISDRKQAEEKLTKSEQLYRTAIEGTGAVAYVRNHTTREYEYIGPGIQDLLGYTPAEFTVETWNRVIQQILPFGVDRGLSIAEADSVLKRSEGAGWWADIRVRTAAGEERWLLNSVVRVLDREGNVTGSLGILQNVTQRKQAEDSLRAALQEMEILLEQRQQVEQSLRQANDVLQNEVSERCRAENAYRESEQQMRLFMEATADCLWNWDLITGDVMRSVGFIRAFGYSAQEMDSSITWWEERLHPDDRRRVLSTFQDTVASGGNTCSYVYRFCRGDATYAVINDHAYIVRDDKGKPVRALGAMTDITERKQAEEALQQNAERLRALSHRLVDVQEEERRHLARELHDEIGQLLTCAEFALKASVSDLPASAVVKLHEARAVIGEALKRVRELSFTLRPALLDHIGLPPALRSLIEHYTASTGVRVNFHQAGLDSRLAPDLETAAYRIIQEALTNVARHAGVKETVVRIWVNADQVELQVEDEGVGFDQEAALAASRSSGLLGMYERVRLLGGRLTIESAPGGGTHLLAQLPVRNQARGDGP